MPLRDDSLRREAVQIFIKGHAFRCERCKSNVFTKIGRNKYECNGCNALYEGKCIPAKEDNKE